MWLMPALAASLWIAATSSDDNQPAPEPARGGSGRIAWDASRLDGSPDPPLPFKMVRGVAGVDGQDAADPDAGTRDAPGCSCWSIFSTGADRAG